MNMLDFDFNSVKKVSEKNATSISAFDSICEDLRNLFNMIFKIPRGFKFIYEKAGQYINVDMTNIYRPGTYENININFLKKNDFPKFLSISNKISPYLKYIKLNNAILNLSSYVIDRNPQISDIIKQFAYTKKLLFYNFNLFDISNIDNFVNFIDETTPKNEIMLCTASPIVGIPTYTGKYPKIYSKKLFLYSGSIISDFISVGENNGYFFDIYSNEIMVNLSGIRIKEKKIDSTLVDSTLAGIIAFDNSIKNNNAKIIFAGCKDSYLQYKIEDLNLKHYFVLDYIIN